MVYGKSFEGWGLAGAYMTKWRKEAGRKNGVREGYKDMISHQEARHADCNRAKEEPRKESEEIARWKSGNLQAKVCEMDDENSLWPG